MSNSSKKFKNIRVTENGPGKFSVQVLPSNSSKSGVTSATAASTSATAASTSTSSASTSAAAAPVAKPAVVLTPEQQKKVNAIRTIPALDRMEKFYNIRSRPDRDTEIRKKFAQMIDVPVDALNGKKVRKLQDKDAYALPDLDESFFKGSEDYDTYTSVPPALRYEVLQKKYKEMMPNNENKKLVNELSEVRNQNVINKPKFPIPNKFEIFKVSAYDSKIGSIISFDPNSRNLVCNIEYTQNRPELHSGVIYIKRSNLVFQVISLSSTRTFTLSCL